MPYTVLIWSNVRARLNIATSSIEPLKSRVLSGVVYWLPSLPFPAHASLVWVMGFTAVLRAPVDPRYKVAWLGSMTTATNDHRFVGINRPDLNVYVEEPFHQ